MKLNKYVLMVLSTLILSTSITSCKKTSTKNACYNDELFQKSKNLSCTQDCPGVIGCDEKNYCNACEAAKQGISVR